MVSKGGHWLYMPKRHFMQQRSYDRSLQIIDSFSHYKSKSQETTASSKRVKLSDEILSIEDYYIWHQGVVLSYCFSVRSKFYEGLPVCVQKLKKVFFIHSFSIFGKNCNPFISHRNTGRMAAQPSCVLASIPFKALYNQLQFVSRS